MHCPVLLQEDPALRYQYAERWSVEMQIWSIPDFEKHTDLGNKFLMQRQWELSDRAETDLSLLRPKAVQAGYSEFRLTRADECAASVSSGHGPDGLFDLVYRMDLIYTTPLGKGAVKNR